MSTQTRIISPSGISEGLHRLEFYASDKTGTRSNVKSVSFTRLKVFNVRDYGAKGDGITGDTKAIKAAIDAARDYINTNTTTPTNTTTAPYAIVYFPSGDYFIGQSGAIEYTGLSRIIFRGDNANNTRIIRNNNAGTLFRFISCSDLQFRNLNYYFTGPSRTTALQFRTSISNLIIDSCIFSRDTRNDATYYSDPNIAPYDYIAFMTQTTSTTATMSNITITNNQFYDAPEDCIAFKVGGWQPMTLDGPLRIEGNRFIRVSSSHRLTLNNEPRPGAAITYSNPSTERAFISIRNNYFECTAEYRHSIAIGYNRFRNCIIEGNTVRGFTQGIRAFVGYGTDKASYNVMIRNNTLDGRDLTGTPNIYPFGSSVDAWRNSGIVIHGENISVDGNTVQYYGLYGFYLYYIDRSANIPSTNVTLTSNNTIANNNRAGYSWVRDIGYEM